MKKTLILCLLGGLFALRAAAAEPVERIYVSTDKGTYVAGDLIGCSLFCLDASGAPAYSDGSAVAYLELISRDGTAATGKIALLGGRGAGVVPIPLSVPTGSYSLVAYTARNCNEEGRGYLSAPKTLFIYNTLSTQRVRDGVDWSGTAPKASDPAFGALKLQVNRRAKTQSVIPLSVASPEAASVSVSVYRLDDLPAPENGSVGTFVASLPAPGTVRFTGDRLPDFDGEVIRASIAGPDRDKAAAIARPVAVISAQGAASDTYVSEFSDGNAVFFTNNIYGDRDLVCEVVGMEDGASCYLQLESPFLGPSLPDPPLLPLGAEMRGALQERHAAMLALRDVPADTLFDFLPKRENLLLRRADAKIYHLDDYVRFPTVNEVLVEIIPELRVRKGRLGTREIQMLATDDAGALSFFRDNILVLLDGIAVTDHARILEFDAMLFDDVEIYPQSYLLGSAVYGGIVNFRTRRGGSLSLRLSDFTQVIDFQGASYPLAMTGRPGAGVQDLRQTLYWHPAVSLPGGSEPVRLDVLTPSYPGRFRVVVEGLDERMQPLRATAEFEVY